jgi:hypothetical protein
MIAKKKNLKNEAHHFFVKFVYRFIVSDKHIYRLSRASLNRIIRNSNKAEVQARHFYIDIRMWEKEGYSAKSKRVLNYIPCRIYL